MLHQVEKEPPWRRLREVHPRRQGDHGRSRSVGSDRSRGRETKAKTRRSFSLNRSPHKDSLLSGKRDYTPPSWHTHTSSEERQEKSGTKCCESPSCQPKDNDGQRDSADAKRDGMISSVDSMNGRDGIKSEEIVSMAYSSNNEGERVASMSQHDLVVGSVPASHVGRESSDNFPSLKIFSAKASKEDGDQSYENKVLDIVEKESEKDANNRFHSSPLLRTNPPDAKDESDKKKEGYQHLWKSVLVNGEESNSEESSDEDANDSLRSSSPLLLNASSSSQGGDEEDEANNRWELAFVGEDTSTSMDSTSSFSERVPSLSNCSAKKKKEDEYPLLQDHYLSHGGEGTNSDEQFAENAENFFGPSPTNVSLHSDNRDPGGGLNQRKSVSSGDEGSSFEAETDDADCGSIRTRSLSLPSFESGSFFDNVANERETRNSSSQVLPRSSSFTDDVTKLRSYLSRAAPRLPQSQSSPAPKPNRMANVSNQKEVTRNTGRAWGDARYADVMTARPPPKSTSQTTETKSPSVLTPSTKRLSNDWVSFNVENASLVSELSTETFQAHKAHRIMLLHRALLDLDSVEDEKPASRGMMMHRRSHSLEYSTSSQMTTVTHGIRRNRSFGNKELTESASDESQGIWQSPALGLIEKEDDERFIENEDSEVPQSFEGATLNRRGVNCVTTGIIHQSESSDTHETGNKELTESASDEIQGIWQSPALGLIEKEDDERFIENEDSEVPQSFEGATLNRRGVNCVTTGIIHQSESSDTHETDVTSHKLEEHCSMSSTPSSPEALYELQRRERTSSLDRPHHGSSPEGDEVVAISRLGELDYGEFSVGEETPALSREHPSYWNKSHFGNSPETATSDDTLAELRGFSLDETRHGDSPETAPSSFEFTPEVRSSERDLIRYLSQISDTELSPDIGRDRLSSLDRTHYGTSSESEDDYTTSQSSSYGGGGLDETRETIYFEESSASSLEENIWRRSGKRAEKQRQKDQASISLASSNRSQRDTKLKKDQKLDSVFLFGKREHESNLGRGRMATIDLESHFEAQKKVEEHEGSYNQDSMQHHAQTNPSSGQLLLAKYLAATGLDSEEAAAIAACFERLTKQDEMKKGHKVEITNEMNAFGEETGDIVDLGVPRNVELMREVGSNDSVMTEGDNLTENNWSPKRQGSAEPKLVSESPFLREQSTPVDKPEEISESDDTSLSSAGFRSAVRTLYGREGYATASGIPCQWLGDDMDLAEEPGEGHSAMAEPEQGHPDKRESLELGQPVAEEPVPAFLVKEPTAGHSMQYRKSHGGTRMTPMMEEDQPRTLRETLKLIFCCYSRKTETTVCSY